MKPKIILIAGEAESGKDTFAQNLVHNLKENYNAKRYAFGDEVKYIARVEYGWNGKKDKKGRRLLQLVGELYRLVYGKDYWISWVYEYIQKDKPQIAIITDCRYVNESEWFDKNGYKQIVIKIKRDGYDNSLTEKQRQHESEQQISKIDADFSFSCQDLIELNKSVNYIGNIVWRRW